MSFSFNVVVMELHVYMRWYYIVLSVLLSVTFCTDATCENRNCLNNECLGDGSCLSGCRDGFVLGDKGQCIAPCSNNCAKCEKDVCTECQPGYYGPRCMKPCDGCRNGSCEVVTGQCKTGCKDGYHSVPWCNSTRLPDGNTHHQHQKAGPAKLHDEEKSRKLYIWIAGAIIVSVILAVIVIIIVAVRGREKDTKSSYDIPASEHLTTQNEETTEIV